MEKTLNIIPYFGGKTVHLNFLHSYFPDPSKVKHFVDAMCGSAAVGINSNYSLVTINDINKDVINFFEVLRNDKDRFFELIKYTPFSREEFFTAGKPVKNKIERARRFFIRACQGFGGVSSQNNHSGWACNIAPGEKESHFRCDTWQSKLLLIEQIAFRLRGVQIESLPVLQILKKYNHPSIFIYLDPPYVLSTRGEKRRYKFEFTINDHIEISTAANESKSLIAISGYDSPMYDELYPTDKWYKVIGEGKKNNVKKVTRREVLWLNYNPYLLNGQLNLFQQ